MRNDHRVLLERLLQMNGFALPVRAEKEFIGTVVLPGNGISFGGERLRRTRSLFLPWSTEEGTVVWTILVVLLLLWIIGLASDYTMGGFIHVLLIAAIAILLLRVLRGDRPIV